MIIEKGSVNTGVFIEFLKRLIKDAGREIFLIFDRGPAHRAKKAGAFGPTLGGRLRLFFLPPYAPDRNPAALIWKHGKAAGRMAVTVQGRFPRKFAARCATAKQRAKNPLLLCKVLAQLRRVNMN